MHFYYIKTYVLPIYTSYVMMMPEKRIYSSIIKVSVWVIFPSFYPAFC